MKYSFLRSDTKMKICRLVFLVSVLAFASSYAAGLVVPPGGIALGEVLSVAP